MLIEPLESRVLLSSTPYSGTPVSLPATIQAENFDNGGEGVAFHSPSAVNLGGQYRNTGVSIESTSDAGGGYDVGWTHAGEWLGYTINVPTAGNYDLAVRVADAFQGGSFHVEVDGTNVSGSMTIPNTGSWQNYVTLTKTAIPVAAGNHLIKLVMDSEGTYGFVGNFNWFKLSAGSVGTPPESARNLLFFGNSFTLYNNLPSIVSQIAVAEGHVQPNVYAQATFGWTLTDHLNKIAADGSNNIIVHSLPAGATWDDVVMQDLSTRPASVTAAPVNGNAAAFRADAAALFNAVHRQSPNVKDVLFETWARGADSLFYPGSYPNPSAMQNDVFAQYNGAAWDANHAFGPNTAILANAGEAWRANNFAPSLYDGPDEYHPSQRGSVLAALVVYRAVYHDNTAAIPLVKVSTLLAAEGLTATDWQQLTAVADRV